MLQDFTGYWLMDGIDLWQAFRLVIHKGSTTFLEFPPIKQNIEHDWRDAHGIDVDLTQIFFAAREITLECSIICNGAQEFIKKRDSMMELLRKPGHRRLQFKSTGQRSFYVHYKDANGWQAVDAIPESGYQGQVMYLFNLIVRETDPAKGLQGDVFLITEDGRYIIT